MFKSLKISGFLIMMAILLFPARAIAAGTVTETADAIQYHMVKIKFVCVGDSSDGSIPDTTISQNVKGYYL